MRTAKLPLLMYSRSRRLPPPPPRCSFLVVPLFALLFVMLLCMAACTMAPAAEPSSGPPAGDSAPGWLLASTAHPAAPGLAPGSPAPPSEGNSARSDQVVRRASWYGEDYRGRLMANGEPFDPDAMTCAAWNYPLGTRLAIWRGSKRVVVRVTDRGPGEALVRAGVSIDLSRQAFAALGELGLGHLQVTVQSLKP